MKTAPRYIPVQIDRRTGAHQLLRTQSVPHDEAIFALQSLGPAACPSQLDRAMILVHAGDGESWWPQNHRKLEPSG
jgi:hypothetical protein